MDLEEDVSAIEEVPRFRGKVQGLGFRGGLVAVVCRGFCLKS